jgi:ribonuclease HI
MPEPTRSQFICQECGTSFTLSPNVVQRYPGWTPKQCRNCKNGGEEPVEENLPVAGVLKRYHDGPQDGVFTDGSAHPNPGPGGWGAVYVIGGEIIGQTYGSEPHTTNNRMELTALLHGFDLVPVGTPATVYSDSNLCVRIINEWARRWAANGWRRKGGPIANLDLVKAVYEKAHQRPELQVRWIRAHDGSRWNEYADALSTAYRRPIL